MSISRDTLLAFLYREARLLDDRQWDDWLECYSPDAEFWMPAWDDHDTLTQDPQSEISLIYYPSRDGLEDRVDTFSPETTANYPLGMAVKDGDLYAALTDEIIR